MINPVNFHPYKLDKLEEIVEEEEKSNEKDNQFNSNIFQDGA